MCLLLALRLLICFAAKKAGRWSLLRMNLRYTEKDTDQIVKVQARVRAMASRYPIASVYQHGRNYDCCNMSGRMFVPTQDVRRMEGAGGT